MTLTELLAQLEANNAKSSGFLTADQLKSMAASASVDLAKPVGSLTLLYSGGSGVKLPDPDTAKLVSVSNTDIAETIGKNSGGMVRTMGQTDVGKLLLSQEFLGAATKFFGTKELADSFIYGARDSAGNRISQGQFDDASARFIDRTGGGDFRSLTSFAGSDKVFGQTELIRFMADPLAKSHNGIAKEIYQDVYDKAFAKGGINAANEAVFNAAKYSSAILGEGIQVSNDGGTLKVGTGSLLEGTGAARQTLPFGATNVETLGNGYITGIQDKPSLAADIKAGGIALGEAEMSLLARGNTTARIGMNALGAAGGVLAAAATIYTTDQINVALARGDTATANTLARQLTASWTGGLAAGVAAGGLAAELLSPLLAGGPVGGATYLVLVGASALVGGYWGTEAFDALLSKLDFNPHGSVLNTYLTADKFTRVTEFTNGVILKEPMYSYTDAAGVYHVLVISEDRSSKLEVPDGNGGYTTIEAGTTGSKLTQWVGEPSVSAVLRKIETTLPTPGNSAVTSVIEGPAVRTYVGTTLTSTGTVQTFDDGSILELHTPANGSAPTLRATDINRQVRTTELLPSLEQPTQQQIEQRQKLLEDDLFTGSASFLNALRAKDKVGMLLAGGKMGLDYARYSGANTSALDGFLGNVSTAVGVLGALQGLRSRDTLTQLGSAGNLLRSANYIAGQLGAKTTSIVNGTAQSAPGLLGADALQLLNQFGAVLSIAGLANLPDMLDNGQYGSAIGTTVGAINGAAFLVGATTTNAAGTVVAVEAAGELAFIPMDATTLVIFVVAIIAIDVLMKKDPPPQPPTGEATFRTLANGSLSYDITNAANGGNVILVARMGAIVDRLNAQIAYANGKPLTPAQITLLALTPAQVAALADRPVLAGGDALALVASRMPKIMLQSWPDASNNGISNFFFLVESKNPQTGKTSMNGISRLDLVDHFAEALVYPQAIVSQWEVNHLSAKFGANQANWQTEGQWANALSPIEQQRRQLE